MQKVPVIRKTIVLLIILITFFLSNAEPSIANEQGNYENYMNNWNEKIKLASEYLKIAETELKNGDAIQSCVNQKKAAKYGIEASKSLIKAFKENGSKEDIENIEIGLKKWKELRDFC